MSTDQSSRPTAGNPEQPGRSEHPTSGAGRRSRHQRPAGPLGSSAQAEASGQLVAMSFPGARRVAGWLFWVIFPLLCLWAIYTSAQNFHHHIGKKPEGIRGTFVVEPRSCSQGFCSFGGLFTSDDKKIKNLPLIGDPRWQTGQVHQVVYDPTKVEVGALPGHWDPTASVVATLGALTYLIVVGYFYRAERSERAQSRAGTVPVTA
ncbi:MAG TPA: hypothetical protein VHO01_09365 [Jatrophihabitans sp.]|nr:hypothetical protein [Jatrophihabitans sp.]